MVVSDVAYRDDEHRFPLAADFDYRTRSRSDYEQIRRGVVETHVVNEVAEKVAFFLFFGKVLFFQNIGNIVEAVVFIGLPERLSCTVNYVSVRIFKKFFC